MAEIAALLVALAALGVVVWLALRLQGGSEKKHREMLTDLHDGLTKQGDRLGYMTRGKSSLNALGSGTSFNVGGQKVQGTYLGKVNVREMIEQDKKRQYRIL